MNLRFLKGVSFMFLSLAAAITLIPPAAGDDYRYESRGRRDPFVPLVGMDRPTVSKLEDVVSITDLKLEGIASSPAGKPIAILNGEIVKEGDRFGIIDIKKITKKTVTVVMGGRQYDKDLSEEGGTNSGR